MNQKQREHDALVRSRMTAGVEVINAPHRLRHDMYNAVLAAPWWRVILFVFVFYFGANALFALAFFEVGGVHGVPPGSYWDYFFFSVQTLGTIGYGSYYPETTAAHLFVSLESFTGLTLVAVLTGIIFSKFSIPTARMVFTTQAVVTPLDGIPTLMFRVGNERGNYVINAQIQVSLMRGDRSKEGVLLYRNFEMPLVRDRAAVLTRSFTVMHRITPQSPLYGETPAELIRKDANIIVTVIGLDGTSSQTIFAGWSYPADTLAFGSRHRDMLTELPDGRTIADFANFDLTIPSEATEDFPYPAPLLRAG